MDAPSRIASLDAFRGFAIASMLLVNNPGDWSHIYAPLEHADWNGWTFTDTVFPFFLFIAGVSMTVSLARRSREGAGGEALVAAMAKRAAIIFAIGLALNFIPALDPATVRIPGVLQRIALCVLIAAPVVVASGPRGIAAAIAILFALYAATMLLVPVPDATGAVARGLLEPGRDFGSFVDRAVFGPHLWAQSKTWDPEGLMSTLPAVATLLFGSLAGHWIATRRSERGKARGLFFGGAIGIAAGLALDAAFMPINKNLWTPSYVVFMAGVALVAFGAFYTAVDAAPPRTRERLRKAAFPLTVFGMNALFLFALSGLVARLLVAIHPGGVTLKARLFAPLQALPIAPENASLLYAIAFDLAFLAIAWFMWKKRWFVKA
jgi:predicted acyltransferase